MKPLFENVEFLLGKREFSNATLLPFEKVIINFLKDFSNGLNDHIDVKKYADLKSLAFWCREKNILKNYNFDSNNIRLSLGRVFHITPSNIPTNFAYSMIFGLINGNNNIVKVPSKNFAQINIICEVLKKILKKNRYKKIKEMITIVKYSSNDKFTEEVSKICNARVIWGGDKTISEIRKIPIPERSYDISFADRYSFCVINLMRLKKLNDYNFKLLIERFYNDTYLVDQNACSSPHLLVWLGKSKEIKKKFWKYLLEITKRKYKLTNYASISKYNKLCENILSLENISSSKTYENYIYTNKLKKLNKDNHKLRGKWGFFYELETNNLNSIANFINNRYQTLTYYGVNKETVKNFLKKNNVRGIDRIVPIGQALDISFQWDGFDINKVFSRVVEIK
jgi:hypothetical protein